MLEKNKLVIWPIYFDAARSRSQGRMVPLQDAIHDPTLDRVISAATRSGLKPEIERERRHPKTWHEAERAGRILVPKSGPKSEILKQIAAILKTTTGKRDDKRWKAQKRAP